MFSEEENVDDGANSNEEVSKYVHANLSPIKKRAMPNSEKSEVISTESTVKGLINVNDKMCSMSKFSPTKSRFSGDKSKHSQLQFVEFDQFDVMEEYQSDEPQVNIQMSQLPNFIAKFKKIQK